ncbi:MAG: LysR family transcriptional regulator [Streptosporangiaceae bacterium]
MELRQLEYLIAVAEEANFTRAAERVRISQPGVSTQIRQLEHELGAQLIDRSGRRASLTAAGEAVLEHARAALAAAGAARQAADAVNGLLRGQLTVGMVTGCTVTPLFDALAGFHHAHGGVDITLIEGGSAELAAGVRAGRTDLALVGTAGEPSAEVGSFTVVSERLVAMVPAGHPLLDHGLVRLREVTACPLICMPPGTGLRSVLDQACAAAGLRPIIAVQASAGEAIMQLAQRGLGVGILSESMTGTGRDGLTARVIDDVRIPAVLAVIWSPVASPALRELIARCRAAFGQPLTTQAMQATQAQ